MKTRHTQPRDACAEFHCFYSWSQYFYMSLVYEFTVWFHIHIIDGNVYFKIILFTAHVCSLFLSLTLASREKTFIRIGRHLAGVHRKTIIIKSQNPPLIFKVWLKIEVVTPNFSRYFFKQNFRIKTFHFIQVVKTAQRCRQSLMEKKHWINS